MAEIKELMKYEAAGDPVTGLKWSRITPGKIARIITGLKVCSYLDQRQYEKGLRISDEIMHGLAIETAQDLGKWNYTLHPQ